jgi:hypothetical protein
MQNQNQDPLQSWAEEALGIKKPRNFILDASILDGREAHEVVQDEIKQNHVEYEFPDGLNKLDLYEECRALTLLDDLEAMYDVTMQLLVGKSVIIRLKNKNGSKTELCSFQVVDRFQNLRAIAAIDEYPCLMLWLTEFIGATLLKKYPVPRENALPPATPEPKGSRKRQKKSVVPEAVKS